MATEKEYKLSYWYDYFKTCGLQENGFILIVYILLGNSRLKTVMNRL
jgi:hypothetical protein